MQHRLLFRKHFYKHSVLAVIFELWWFPHDFYWYRISRYILILLFFVTKTSRVLSDLDFYPNFCIIQIYLYDFDSECLPCYIFHIILFLIPLNNTHTHTHTHYDLVNLCYAYIWLIPGQSPGSIIYIIIVLFLSWIEWN